MREIGTFFHNDPSIDPPQLVEFPTARLAVERITVASFERRDVEATTAAVEDHLSRIHRTTLDVIDAN